MLTPRQIQQQRAEIARIDAEIARIDAEIARLQAERAEKFRLLSDALYERQSKRRAYVASVLRRGQVSA